MTKFIATCKAFKTGFRVFKFSSGSSLSQRVAKAYSLSQFYYSHLLYQTSIFNQNLTLKKNSAKESSSANYQSYKDHIGKYLASKKVKNASSFIE